MNSLALEGGPKVRTTPWPVRRLFGEQEKAAVIALFDRAIADGSHLMGYNGEQETKYCEEFAKFLGGGFADGVNSGTNAVYVALRSLDLEPGSEVIVPPISDPGGYMPVPLCHCIPVVADAAPGSYNTGAEQIAAQLTPRTRAILVAHIAGIPCDMDPILQLARTRGIPVIEDCAQSHGAMYGGKMTGSLGDIAAFSTMFGKHHATGGQGGVVFTKSESRYWRARQMADRGKPFGLPAGHNNVVASLNNNMDELHATIGRVQLRRLPDILARRRKLARLIEQALKERTRTIRVMTGTDGSESAYWFLFLRVELNRLTADRSRLIAAFAAEGLPQMSEGYFHAPTAYEWFRNRAVYGTSGLPWSNATDAPPIDLRNITATDAECLQLLFHEDWTERDAADLIEGIAKVESAFLR